MAKSTAAKTTNSKTVKPAAEKPAKPSAPAKAKVAAPVKPVEAVKPAVSVAKPALKPAAKTSAKTAANIISAQDRYHMIDEAAYYRAEKSGFQVDPHENWIAAEKEINELMSKHNIKVG